MSKRRVTPDRAKAWKPATRQVRAGLNRSQHDETCEAIHQTSGYVYETAQEAMESFDGTRERNVYSRFRNPTVQVFEERLAAIEGAAECRATASGMAAVHAALMADARAGDHFVAAKALFSSCIWILSELMPRYGMQVTLVDGTDLAQWERALSRPTKAVLLETPSNPTLEIIDLKAVADLAHAAGARVWVDNVFATPILQRPMEYGADGVIYSSTKYIDGQGRGLGGAILVNDLDYLNDQLWPFLRHTGPTLSPFNAWNELKGLETLGLRMERHCANARAVADFLAGHPKVSTVLYPGLTDHPGHALAMAQMAGQGGGMVAFAVPGGRAGAFAVLDALEIPDISNNLGDAKSLITHPATTTHQRLTDAQRAELGISDGMIRFSVGLEDKDDLIADLDRALG